MSGPPKAPGWCRQLTALLLRGEARDVVEGDLEERFHRRVRERGEKAARRWFVRQTFASIGAVWFGVLRRGARRAASTTSGVHAAGLRRTLRTLVRHPGYAASVILTLGLGLGATTAVFSVVDGVLLRPLDLESPEDLVAVWMTQQGEPTNLAGANGLDLRDDVGAFEGLFLFSQGNAVLEEGLGGRLRPLPSVGTTEGVLRVLGVRPLLGRGFRESDTEVGAPPVVLVTHGLWQEAFGSDPSWIGRTTMVDGRPTEIVGVLPEGFTMPMAPDARLIQPLTRDETFMARDLIWLGGVARLAPDADVRRARAEAGAVWEGIRSAHPDMILDHGVAVIPLQSYLVEDVRSALLVLLGATGLLLAMACVSVGGLLLARGRGRRAELALRASMGAGRGRVISELVLEGLLLTTAATAIGIALARGLLFAMRQLGPADLPRLFEVGLDGRVLLVSTLGALVVGLLTSGVPAIRATRDAPASSLVRSGRGAVSARGSRRSRFTTVSVQVGLATVLLATAGVLGRSFFSLISVHPGFEVDDMVLARVALPSSEYEDREARTTLYRRLLEDLEGVAEVEQSGIALLAPLSDARINYEIAVDGEPVEPPGEAPEADLQLASGGYFEAMGIPLLAGRLFTDADPEGPPVALVSESLAVQLWGEAPAVGRQIGWVVDRAQDPQWFEVVGVVGDVRQQSVADAPNGTLILDFMSRPQYDATVAVRVRGDGARTASLLREMVPLLGPGIPEPEITTLRASRSADVAPERFMALLLVVFSTFAVLLAAVGTYASMAYSMAQRRGEMGLRLAMGAAPRRLVNQTLVQGMAPVLVGLVVGTGAALAAGGALQGLVFEVAARDPLSLSFSAAALAAVGFVACLVPAMRTARIDPVESLRER